MENGFSCSTAYSLLLTFSLTAFGQTPAAANNAGTNDSSIK